MSQRTNNEPKGDIMKSVIIDGVNYIEEVARGNRAVVVVDRGWIFAGDVYNENGKPCGMGIMRHA